MDENLRRDSGQKSDDQQSNVKDQKKDDQSANDGWNLLLDGDESCKNNKKENGNILGNILDISNIQPLSENQIKDEDDQQNASLLEANFSLEQQDKVLENSSNQKNNSDSQKDVEDPQFLQEINQRKSVDSNKGINLFESSPIQEKNSKHPLNILLNGQNLNHSNLKIQNSESMKYSNKSSPLLPNLSLGQKSSSFKEHGYMQILKTQKCFLEPKLSLQNLSSDSKEIVLPSTNQNLDQNIYSFEIGIDKLNNLNIQSERKSLYETMKTFLETEQKVQIITNFEDLSYSSTGIYFQTASYREGEKGMKVIVCHNQETENKINYINDEESSLTEYCDLQLLEKITYIIDQLQDENSPCKYYQSIGKYLKKLMIIVTEKPKISFRRFLNKKIQQSKQFSEEQFKGCIKKLIRNVLYRHNSCIASTCLIPQKIFCLFESRVCCFNKSNDNIIISDLGESIVQKDLDLRESDTFQFESSDYSEPLTLYSSPEEQRIVKEDQTVFYDPYKIKSLSLKYLIKKNLISQMKFKIKIFISEIFSLGKIILEICLIKYQSYFMKKYSSITKEMSSQGTIDGPQLLKKWIQHVLSDNELSYKIAEDLYEVVNEIILGKQNTQYFFKKGVLRKLRMPNILQQMLEVKQENRISSIKLALLTQSEKLLIKNRIQDPFPMFFKGQMHPDGYIIKYPNSKLTYEGEIDTQTGEKHRKGLIRKQLDQDQDSRLIVEFGQFNKGRLNGQARMNIFQNHWKLVGGCYNNCIHGNNQILYKDKEVFKGYFSNFILNEWYDIDNTDPVIQNVKVGSEVRFRIENDIEIKVNNQENLIKCYNDKTFDSLIEFCQLYESSSLCTFKKFELHNCGSPNKIEQILKCITSIVKLKIDNTFINIDVLLQHQQKLQQIEISNNQYFTDENLITLVTHPTIQQQLKKLCIDLNSKITSKGIKELSMHISNITKLQYFSCKKVCSIQNNQQEKVKSDEITQAFINLLSNSFHVYFLILDYTLIKDVTLQKVLENKKQTPIKWQYLSLNGCEFITKDGLRDLFGCKYLTDLKKIDLMHCSNPKFDVPSKNLKACPQILNLAYSSGVTGNQLEKFISRNNVVSTNLQQLSINVNVLDSKARDGLKKLTNPLVLILCIKEVSKIPNAELCLDILASIKSSGLYMTSDKPINQNEVNLTFSQSSKSQYAKKIKFNRWKDGEFLSEQQTPPGSPNPQICEDNLGEEQEQQQINIEKEENLKKECGLLRKRNLKDEQNKDAIKLLGFFNYRQEELQFTVRIMTRIFNNANIFIQYRSRLKKFTNSYIDTICKEYSYIRYISITYNRLNYLRFYFISSLYQSSHNHSQEKQYHY